MKCKKKKKKKKNPSWYTENWQVSCTFFRANSGSCVCSINEVCKIQEALVIASLGDSKASHENVDLF